MQVNFTKVIPQDFIPTRVDVALAVWLPEYSRARIQTWIKEGFVTVDDKTIRPKDKVTPGQTINLHATLTDTTCITPQPLALDIIHTDQDLIIINKPSGLVTHPGAGNPDNTLLNALLYHYPELSLLPRGGIIHRLDKDTSGILVVARNLTAHNYLTTAMQKRLIQREYAAIVTGQLIAGGNIETSIGRHPTKRTLMSVRTHGKNALTHYRILQRFTHYSYIKVLLATGRTHQIRVHMLHIGHPLVGDPTYNNRRIIPLKIHPLLRKKLENFKRQALHARRLTLTHPRTHEVTTWETKLPKDMQQLLAALERYAL